MNTLKSTKIVCLFVFGALLNANQVELSAQTGGKMNTWRSKKIESLEQRTQYSYDQILSKIKDVRFHRIDDFKEEYFYADAEMYESDTGEFITIIRRLQFAELWKSRKEFIEHLEDLKENDIGKPMMHLLEIYSLGDNFLSNVDSLAEELHVNLSLSPSALDYTVNSLQRLDERLSLTQFSLKELKKIYPMFVAYVGKVVIRSSEGHWEVIRQKVLHKNVENVDNYEIVGVGKSVLVNEDTPYEPIIVKGHIKFRVWLSVWKVLFSEEDGNESFITTIRREIAKFPK